MYSHEIRVGPHALAALPGKRSTLEVPGMTVHWTGDAVRVQVGSISTLSGFNRMQSPQKKFQAAFHQAIERIDYARSQALLALKFVRPADIGQTDAAQPSTAEASVARIDAALARAKAAQPTAKAKAPAKAKPAVAAATKAPKPKKPAAKRR